MLRKIPNYNKKDLGSKPIFGLKKIGSETVHKKLQERSKG